MNRDLTPFTGALVEDALQRNRAVFDFYNSFVFLKKSVASVTGVTFLDKQSHHRTSRGCAERGCEVRWRSQSSAP